MIKFGIIPTFCLINGNKVKYDRVQFEQSEIEGYKYIGTSRQYYIGKELRESNQDLYFYEKEKAIKIY